MKHWSVLMVCLLIVASTACRYRLYNARDASGHRHRIRGYKSYRREHKFYDKVTVKEFFEHRDYPTSPNFSAPTDTTVVTDSVKLFVSADSKEYAPMFTLGVVPCQLVGNTYGKMSEIPGVELLPFTEVTDQKVKTLSIYDVHRLRYIHARRGHRFYRFHITPYVFYAELTGKKPRRKTTEDEFMKNAKLTWFYKAKVVEL